MERRSIADLLVQRTVERHVPIEVMVETTHRCNLACRHCYLDGLPPSAEPELSTAELVDLLDQLRSMGTLHLSLTGGELFVRQDLGVILEAAVGRGFVPKLFTNATLIDESWAARLGELGLVLLSVSIHGARPETHDWMTRRPGSFEKMLAGVRRARAHGVPVALKAPLTHRNASEREAMRSLARELGAEFRMDPVISARHCGSRDTLCFRLGHEELVDLFRSENMSAGAAGSEPAETQDADLTCLAGINGAFISAVGAVRPCVEMLVDCGRLREASFSEIWHGSSTLHMLRGLTDGNVTGCAGCPRRNLCIRCSGLALLEDGDLLGRSSAACHVAQAREEALAGSGPNSAESGKSTGSPEIPMRVGA